MNSWEETVQQQILAKYPGTDVELDLDWEILRIAFKAGEEKEYAHVRQHCEDVIIPQEIAKARREVVEWIEAHGGSLDGHRQEWQTQRKKWGIE